MLRFPASGGPPETIAGLGNGERALANPQILPGGKALLFAAATGGGVDQYTIEILNLADGHRKIVARGGNSPRYLGTSSVAGHLVYINKGTLFAIPFDLDKLETHGTPVPILNNVAYNISNGAGQYDISRTGTLVYRKASSGTSAMMTVQWVDPNGKREPLRTNPGFYQELSLSPDGKRVALTVAEGGGRDVWIYDQQRDSMTRLTFGGSVYYYPTWSPNGQYVVFGANYDGIFQVRADGASQPQTLVRNTNAPRLQGYFSPDGKWLAYVGEPAPNYEIWTVPLEDRAGLLKVGTPEQFLKSSFSDINPRFSPDGQWLAYQSNESGKEEVYVRAFPPSSGQAGKWQVSNDGGGVPHWSPNGRELVYQSGDRIMTASYTVKGDTFVADRPRVWIAKLGGIEWDLAPDGKRVAVLTRVDSAEAPKQEHEVVLVENFFDELRRKVPTDK